MKLQLEIESQRLGARTGVVKTASSSFTTPVFMPVGTRGAVRTLAAHDYKNLGAQIILGNTYHLMLRPGAKVISDLGGLGKFSGWDGLTLTDSGGFQVFSLSPKVSDEGVEFRSTYDGEIVNLTPEKAVEIQELLGADIQMVLDVCSALPSNEATLRDAMIRTHDWAKRAKATHERTQDQSLFGIVQGGDSTFLRLESATRTTELDFDGYAIGGLSVGESRSVMIEMLDALAENNSLPADQPRYLMGVGDPLGMVEAIMRGIDMFDCVLPTRLARHGVLLTWQGKVHIRKQENARSDQPIDKDCKCQVCMNYSRALIRHLVAQREPSAPYLCTIHNLSWMFQFIEAIKQAIRSSDTELIELRKKIESVYS